MKGDKEGRNKAMKRWERREGGQQEGKAPGEDL